MGLGDPIVVVEHVPLVARYNVQQIVLRDIGGGKLAFSGEGELTPDVLEEKGKAVFLAVGEELHPQGFGIREIGHAVDDKRDQDKANN